MLGAPKAAGLTLETDSIKKMKAICHLGVNGSEDVVMRATMFMNHKILLKKKDGAVLLRCAAAAH